MLISHRKKFIFTKTIKTAGTSVESYFEKYCMPENKWKFSHTREEYVSEEGIIGFRGTNPSGKKWYNHMPAVEIRDKIGSLAWNSYFKFTVIRNPFDKLISGFYHFERRKYKIQKIAKLKNMIKKLLGNVLPLDYSEIERFRSWIKNENKIIDRNKYLIDDEICVDFFIRYEDLENGIKNVCKKIIIPFEPERIPRLKSDMRNNRFHLNDFYDQETIDIVFKLYEFEILFFGYPPPSIR